MHTRVAILALGLLAAGCSQNPFAVTEADLDRRIDEEKLRRIEPAPLRDYRRAPSPQDAPTLAAPADPFAGQSNVEVSLEQARAWALEHNLDLKVSLVDPAIAQEDLTGELARFESAFTLRAGWQEFDTATASELVSGESNAQQVVPGLRIPLLTGGTVSAELPWTRNENDNSFSTLNPSYTADLGLSISQPLLRGAGRRASTYGIRVASYNQQISQAQTTLEAIRQLAAVDRAYWRLDAARRQLEVEKQQHELAQAQLDRAQRKFDAGDVPQIEVLRAQAGVAQRLEGIINAQTEILTSQRELKRILNAPGLDVSSGALLTPTTQPDPVRYEFGTAELVKKSLDNRMEMLQLELQLASDAAAIDFADNQALPLLTLDYTYRVNGLGGSSQDAWHSLDRNRFEDWELGLNAEIPLGNEQARSRLRRAILQRLQRLMTRQARTQQITQEVLGAVDQIEAGWQRIAATRLSTALSSRTLEAEQRQFDVGNSTSTDVLDAAARLAQAQLAEIQAIRDYQIAQVDLAFATGTLLGASKVDMGPELAPAAVIPPSPPPPELSDKDAVRDAASPQDLTP